MTVSEQYRSAAALHAKVAHGHLISMALYAILPLPFSAVIVLTDTPWSYRVFAMLCWSYALINIRGAWQARAAARHEALRYALLADVIETAGVSLNEIL